MAEDDEDVRQTLEELEDDPPKRLEGPSDPHAAGPGVSSTDSGDG